METIKKILGLLLLPAALVWCASCNDEWTEEQYEHYISFKAPLGDNGVSQISVRYKADGVVTYRLPLIVSGSTDNDRDITVHVAVDSDTLKQLNEERFQSRTDFYYKELGASYFTMPETANIKAGENTGLIDIDFTLNGIDLTDKWVLPLTIVDNPAYGYTSNPRKHYRKALLYVVPFNDYSGLYSTPGLKMYFKGAESSDGALVKNELPTYVVDEETIFFYAGMVDESRVDRDLYKIKASFDPKSGKITLTADNPDMKFESKGAPIFVLDENMDANLPYLLHRYITIMGINYEFTDYTNVPGQSLTYVVQGSITMERKINTQIPDEDQAIEW
jgi:hypothetical protein